MRHRMIAIILLVSMAAYGGGVARSLHHAVTHECDHGPCHIAELLAASYADSCCAHSQGQSHDHSAHGDDLEDADQAPVDHSDHDQCDTCDMLLSISASADGVASFVLISAQPRASLRATRSMPVCRFMQSGGGPRAPPTNIL